MQDTARVREPRPSTVVIGWIFAIGFAAHGVLGVILPRLEKESALREAGRGWHYLLGITTAVLAIVLILRWRKDGFPVPRHTLPFGIRAWSLTVSYALLIMPLIAVPLGFLNAWGEGRMVHLAQVVQLPTLMGANRAVWQFAGYFHSVAGNVLVLLSLVSLLAAGYSFLRYGKGLLAAFPPGFGPLILTKATLFIYAINSFRDRTPGYYAAAITLALVGAIWLIGRVRAPRLMPFEHRASRVWAVPSAVLFAGIITYASFVPYLMFKVTPFATGVVIAADPNLTWHVDRVPGFAVTAETEFERTTAMQTYKWCEFCHTVNAGAKPLVGPNLRNIFGHRAATVPNFYYSVAMAKKGKEGLVWNEKTIAQFIADPQHFVPGTSMQISSGPVTDPQIRSAVVAILKRRTLSDEPEAKQAAR